VGVGVYPAVLASIRPVLDAREVGAPKSSLNAALYSQGCRRA